MLTLKEYQRRALDVLAAYFAECVRTGDADLAFYKTTREVFGVGLSYSQVANLPGLPYVCLRLPTGGGKTLLACHAVGTAIDELLRADHAVVLWLVPSNAILEQTIKALQNPSHPYRQALEACTRSLKVMDVSEALYARRADLDANTTVIVSTMQAFRVDDTEGRKVYESSGSLMDHFSTEALLQGSLERDGNGVAAYSLANVLRMRRPMVIVDEAHNARTSLSFETLARFKPSCILELTATPDTEKSPSNVLYSASAAELQAESMIKLPIILEARSNWKELLARAVQFRGYLESLAMEERRETGEYIRPIMLIQAQPDRKAQKSITVEEVEKSLKADCRVPEEQIRRATGTDRGLEGVDLSASRCEVRYVITVQALREGWDCPFAYVLCSVAEMSSPTAVEQILGRVLRLPGAVRKTKGELNSAYAFVTSRNFAEAASALTDALVQSHGFNRQDARDLVKGAPPEVQPAFWDLEPESREAIARAVNTAGWLSGKAGSPAERGEQLAVPVLAIRQGDIFEAMDESHFMREPWPLSRHSAALVEDEFSLQPKGTREDVEIYISDGGKVQYRFLPELHQQMAMLDINDNWSAAELGAWLDGSIRHPDVTPRESMAFMRGVVQYLITERKIGLDRLVRERYRLRDVVTEKIAEYRKQVRLSSYQALLLPDSPTPVVVTPEVCFSYPIWEYPYNTRYDGAYQFDKHYHPVVGDLKAQGEEFDCARYLDSHPLVKYWVRNLERRSSHSFWLQTSTDKFYPDFVCLLEDGRHLVVEYKGEDRWSNEDSIEKRDIGAVWEARSGGNCLFIMPKGQNLAAIDAKIRS